MVSGLNTASKHNLEVPLWKIYGSQSRSTRCVWSVVFTACSLVFLYQSFDRLQLLIDPPKSAIIKQLLAKTLEFPSVTVCPGYRFRASIARRFPKDTFGCDIGSGVQECSWDFVWNMGTHTEAIFKNCTFRNHWNCLAGNEQRGKWRRVLTSLGRCYTYDSGEHINCGGDLNALEFTVDPMIWDKSGTLTFSGIRIYIHNKNEVPLAEINGINVNEGASAAFALLVKQYNWIYDAKLNPCTSNATYTRSKCIMNCIYEKSLSSANVSCRAPFMNGLKSKICRTRKEIGTLTSKFNDIVNNGTNWNDCSRSHVCPETCTRVTYTPITSSLGSTPNANESLITIKIYFRDMWLETISENWDYTFEDFIADTGGSLNLFWGASCVTIIQMIDYFLTKAWFKWSSYSRRNKIDANINSNNRVDLVSHGHRFQSRPNLVADFPLIF